jgi:Protein of unknown function (DUF2442)
MLNRVVSVKVLAPHVLRVTYGDGFSAVHDFAYLKKQQNNVAAPLADPDYFARVSLNYGALIWPNGYDMCPDWLRIEIGRDGALLGHVAAE